MTASARLPTEGDREAEHENPLAASGSQPRYGKIYNPYWDPREDNPLKYQGVWTGTPFVRMRIQHMPMKDKWPDWKPARGMPYEDVVYLRPKTKKVVETWLKIYGDVKDVVLGVEAAGN